MDKMEQLFIRACKSKEPHRRTERLYRHYYLAYNYSSIDLCRVLIQICEKYDLFNISDLLSALSPSEAWKLGLSETDPYWDRVLKVLISRIRLSCVHQFPGLTAPAKFR